MLRSYDAFNFFTPLQVEALLDTLAGLIRPGGMLLLDLRLPEDGDIGFDDGRQVQRVLLIETTDCSRPRVSEILTRRPPPARP